MTSLPSPRCKPSPPYADGSRVRLDGNTPDQLSDGIRFQLAEDRVQELLMGEQLYGDSDLAVRELYQNALDALRYRDCRTQYLRRTGQTVAPWEGRIEFVQSVRPDGRPYLECRDNGIGMGITELSTVFSQGGARFVDLPEYVEEQAAWAQLPDPKPELHPNSRFGIGVLSYFMLADEIVVRTCRMGRDGRPGRLLQVTIAGPGNFFRVEDLGQGQDAGTSVQLLLSKERRSVSCVSALNNVLWVAPYQTSASHGSRRREWAPGELSTVSLDTQKNVYPRRSRSFCVPAGDAEVWWVDGEGALLADGLLAETEYEHRLYGAVVNLSGDQSPELTVDRKKARAYDREHVLTRMAAAIPSLTRSGSEVVTPSWLHGASTWDLPFADQVADQARRADIEWPLWEDIRVPFARLGFFPPDTDLLPLVTGRYRESDRLGVASFLATIPLPVLRWRLHALYGAGLDGEVSLPDVEGTDGPCARPSDLALLRIEVSHLAWEDYRESWLMGPMASRHSGHAPSRQLAEAGLPSIGSLFDWRDPAESVGTDAVFSLSLETRRPPAEIAERLVALGYRVDPLLGCTQVRYSDLPLLQALGGVGGWLFPGAALSAAQVCLSASAAECSTSRAARRLGELGFTVPAEVPVRAHWSERERQVLSRLRTLYGSRPLAEDVVPVSAAQVTMVAYATDLPVRFITGVLEELGFQLPANAAALPELTDDDKALLRDSHVLRTDWEVPLRYVAAVSRYLDRSVDDVARRLRELGYSVAEVPEDGCLPSRDEIRFLGTGPLDADLGHPLSLMRVARAANAANISLAEAVDRMTCRGYRFAFAPKSVAALRKQDVRFLYYGFIGELRMSGGVTPDAVRAVAEHTGREEDEITASLTALGLKVVPPTLEWSQERGIEYLLCEALRTSDGRPAPYGPNGPIISLVTLAMAAMRAGTSLRTAALMATELGIRHEAESWFSPVPNEPAAPSAVAIPPG